MVGLDVQDEQIYEYNTNRSFGKENDCSACIKYIETGNKVSVIDLTFYGESSVDKYQLVFESFFKKLKDVDGVFLCPNERLLEKLVSDESWEKEANSQIYYKKLK